MDIQASLPAVLRFRSGCLVESDISTPISLGVPPSRRSGAPCSAHGHHSSGSLPVTMPVPTSSPYQILNGVPDSWMFGG